MGPMTSPGDQMDSTTLTPITTTLTTGMTKVMPTSAMHVEDMDALFAEDMAMDTETPSLVSTDIPWPLDLVLDITTSTSETRWDPHITDMDMVLEDATLKDGPTDTETDMDLATERDMVLPTDGDSIMDMDTETQAQRDPWWDMASVPTQQSHNAGK